MATRDLPISEFAGWAIKTDIIEACRVVLAASGTPDPVKALCRTVSDTFADTRLKVLYAPDVVAVAGGLLAAGIVPQVDHDSLIAMLTPPDPTTTRLADAVVMREEEVAHYQANIDSYAAQLAEFGPDLPKEWPAELNQYRGMPPEQVAARVADDETFQTVTDLQQRDRLRVLLRTERGEQSKSVRVLAALTAQVPAEGRDAMLEDARRRRLTALTLPAGG